MRDRLIELILECSTYTPEYSEQARLHAEYLAQHLLNEGVIVPPCKVGDKVYKPIITSKGQPAIWEIIVTSISASIGKNGVSPDSYVIGHLKNSHCGESADFCEFGKTVFLTRDEAEKALKERR